MSTASNQLLAVLQQTTMGLHSLITFSNVFLFNTKMATPSASRWDETPGRPKGSETPGVTPHRPGSETPGATPSTRIWESTPSHVTPGHATPSATPGGNTTPGEVTLLSLFICKSEDV